MNSHFYGWQYALLFGINFPFRCKHGRSYSKKKTKVEATVDLEFLRQAAQDLALGELLSASGFHLGHALSAIEIMDPRMDSGMTVINTENNESTPPSILDKVRLVGLLDRLILYEAAWLNGRALSETLWTFLPFHQDIEDNNGVLKTYCRAVHFSIRAIENIIQYAQEEDINLDRFNVHVGNQSFRDIQRELKEMIEILSCNKENESKRLIEHFRFRLAFLELLEPFSHQQPPFLSDLKNIPHFIDKFMEYLAAVFDAKHFKPDFLYPKYFDEQIFRKLPIRSPPRVSENLSRDDAYRIFKIIEENLREQIGFLLNSDLSFSELLDWLFHIPNYHGMNVLVKSILAISTVHTGLIACQYATAKLIQESVELYTETPYFVNQNLKVQSITQSFLNEATFAMEEAFSACFRNSSRVHRAFGKIISSLDALQSDTEDKDRQLHEILNATKGSKTEPFYLANWVYAVKLRFMERYLFFGFQLDLYEDREYAAAYWYLDYIYSTQLQNFSRVVGIRKTPFQKNFVEHLIKIKRTLLQAIINSINSLEKLKILKFGDASLESPELRFHYRFRTLMRLGSPRIVSLEDYKAHTLVSEQNALAALEAAIKGFETVQATAKQFSLTTNRDEHSSFWAHSSLLPSDLALMEQVANSESETLGSILKSLKANKQIAVHMILENGRWFPNFSFS